VKTPAGMEENKMGVDKGENHFPVIMSTILDKTVPQCRQQKLKFHGVLGEDVEGLRDYFRRVRKTAKREYQLRHVCPSVRMEQLGSRWTDFHEILYLSIFQTYVEKIQVSLKSDKNNGYFTCRPTYIYDNISLSSA
jgi:hypothetical protein